MAKLPRKLQKVFGSTAGFQQLSVIGSLAAAAPAYSTDPETIQSLSNYLGGWFNTVLGANSPAIEDMNSLCYLFAYQLTYIFQSGVPEWNASTTYYIGSFASDSFGGLYWSITDTNLNHVLTDTTYWRRLDQSTQVNFLPNITPTYQLTINDLGSTFLVNSALGVATFTLPATAIPNFAFGIVDVNGAFSTYPVTIARGVVTTTLQGVAASYLCEADYGSWWFAGNSDSTNFWLER